MTPLLAATLVREGHVRSFHVSPGNPAGWEASEHQDQRLVRRHHHTDWHRVEQTLARYTREIAELCEEGWREA